MRKSMPGEAVTGEMLPPNAQRKWPRASALACERRRATPPCQSRPKTWMALRPLQRFVRTRPGRPGGRGPRAGACLPATVHFPKPCSGARLLGPLPADCPTHGPTPAPAPGQGTDRCRWRPTRSEKEAARAAAERRHESAMISSQSLYSDRRLMVPGHSRLRTPPQPHRAPKEDCRTRHAPGAGGMRLELPRSRMLEHRHG
jgi:hypothetical protein